jgi:hypothetical protein
MKPKDLLKLTLIVMASAGMMACERLAEMKIQNQTVELGDAETVTAKIKMGAGELAVQGGASALMEGTFRYRHERLAPEVNYQVFNRKGILTIGQKKRHGLVFGSSKNSWDIRLNNKVPMDMEVDLGAGQTSLDLRGFSIQRLDIDMGVGQLDLDLSGEHSKDMRINIDGGVGQATIYLPETVGVRAEIEGGIGSVQASGFRKAGHVYTNDAYGKSPLSIDLRVDAGIGSIDLRLR